jgi:hypothetical protein
VGDSSVKLTLQNSLAPEPRAFWKREKQPDENYITLHNNITINNVTKSIYLGVHRNGTAFLRARKPSPRDFRFLFRPCYMTIKVNEKVAYSTCWWTGPQTAADIIENIIGQCTT